MKKKTLVMLLLVILAIVITSGLKMYFIRYDSGGTVFWKADHAYIVASGTSRGYRLRYSTYPWMILRTYLNAPPFPDERRVSDIVVQITPSSVERQDVGFGSNTASSPEFLTPYDDGLYALCPGVFLCKWSGTSFQPATDEERKRIGGTDGLNRDPKKTTINGWRVRRFPYSPGEHFEIQLGQDLTIAAKNHIDDGGGSPNITVDLLRSGHATESLYNIDGAARRVTESEYRRIFGNTHTVENE